MTELDFDPYLILGLDENAQEKEIVKAFRKKALEWHPDKNPDRKEYAQSMFLKISKALELLTDAAVRAAYDRLQKAKQAARERTKHLDVKRRKLREELESREAGVQTQKEDEAQATRRLAKEIERLRKEGSKLLQTEQEEVERQVHEETKSKPKQTPSQSTPTAHRTDSASSPRLKIKWKPATAYDEETLRKIFAKYGELAAIVVNNSKKTGSALIEFESPYAANTAVELEKGSEESPLEISWVSGKPERPPQQSATSTTPASSFPSFPSSAQQTAPSTDNRDFESIVLMKMRQAEERRRLIEQMAADDNL